MGNNYLFNYKSIIRHLYTISNVCNACNVWNKLVIHLLKCIVIVTIQVDIRPVQVDLQPIQVDLQPI